MSDLPEKNQNAAQPATPETPVDASRRRLAGSALGVAAVFTLSSRPVWATQCTISGMQSGNLSKPKGTTCNGCPPDKWKNKKDQWNSKCGVSHSLKFKDVFMCNDVYKKNGTSCTLYEVLCKEGNSDECGCQAVAAYLNASDRNMGFAYSPADIAALFRKHYGTTTHQQLQNSLALLNNQNCTI